MVVLNVMSIEFLLKKLGHIVLGVHIPLYGEKF